LSALDEADVQLAVCGALAVAVHARPRATLDIDLLLPRDRSDRARDVSVRLGYRIEAGPRKDVIEMYRFSKPDPETGDLLSLESAWRTRERVAWAHGTLPVVSREGLVEMKRLRGSTTRLVRAAQLRRLCLALARHPQRTPLPHPTRRPR
jgi:hypothetical protein